MTVNFEPIERTSRDLTLSRARLPHGRPLELDLVHISWTRPIHNSLVPLRLFLLPLLNPLRIKLKQHDLINDTLAFLTLYGSASLAGWTKLVTLDFKNRIPVARDGIGPSTLLGLPRPTLDRRRIVRLLVDELVDLGLTEDPPPLGIFLTQLIRAFSADMGLDGMQEGSVVLVVRDEAQRDAAKQAIESCVPVHRKPLFAVEVEATE